MVVCTSRLQQKSASAPMHWPVRTTVDESRAPCAHSDFAARRMPYLANSLPATAIQHTMASLRLECPPVGGPAKSPSAPRSILHLSIVLATAGIGFECAHKPALDDSCRRAIRGQHTA